MHLRRLSPLISVFLLFGLTVQACSQDDKDGGDGDGDQDTNSSSSTDSGDGDTGKTTSSTSSSDTGLDITTASDTTSETSGEGGGGPICETASSDAEIPPVYLAFAFDVSGSMGQLDRPRWWHDPTAKWQPVVEATSAFFEDPLSAGISASMSLFPAQDKKCEANTYLTPEVAMSELPSTQFSAAFAEYEAEVGSPLTGGDWRGGTPTRAALLGVGESLEEVRAQNPAAKFAIVLVTDGLPQGCDGDISDSITGAADFFDEGLPTYVIGIENPKTPPDDLPDGWGDWGNCDGGAAGGDTDPCEAPDTLSALNDLAQAGGTDHAFLIDTGNPMATQAAFRAAIEAIRESSLSCSLPIPDHPESGMSFDKDKINVSVTIGKKTQDFVYDADCEEPGSWRYDDEDSPSSIEICEHTCLDLKTKPDAALNVDFLCEPRPDVIR